MAVKKKKAAAKKKMRSVAKKKTRSAARKKTAARAKAGSKKKKPVAPRFKTHRFKYFCRNNTCGVVPPSKHMAPGDHVVMVATGTDATINFTAGSPFQSNATMIKLKATDPPHQEVVGGPFVPVPRHFPYTIDCTACQSTVVLPPEMIVP